MPQQKAVRCSALTGWLLWKKLQVWLTWQAGDPVWGELKAINHCPSDAHITPAAKQELSCCACKRRNLNRDIRKSCINLERQPQKAPRPQHLHQDLFIYITAWCLLPFFVVGWPREVTFDRYQSQDLVWHTRRFQMPWKRALPFQIRLTGLNNLATPLRWQSLGSTASDELAKTLEECRGSSYGPKKIV